MAKLTPDPSQVAPSGYADPGLMSIGPEGQSRACAADRARHSVLLMYEHAHASPAPQPLRSHFAAAALSLERWNTTPATVQSRATPRSQVSSSSGVPASRCCWKSDH